jgi:DNA-binding response OmpR family regulator
MSRLPAVRNGAPDLVVLDLGLPDIDGPEVLATIRAEGDRMPVVLLTARDEVADKVLGFDFDPGSNVVEVYIRYLRRKVRSHRIRTLRGRAIGWRERL